MLYETEIPVRDAGPTRGYYSAVRGCRVLWQMCNDELWVVCIGSTYTSVSHM